MKYRFILSVKFNGNKVNAGEEKELSDGVGDKLIGKGIVEKICEEPVIPEEPEKEVKVDYSDSTIKELKEVAKEKGIDIKGLKKAKIIEALEE